MITTRRTYYSDYAIWCLKQYAINNGDPTQMPTPSDAIKHSFDCVEKALKRLDDSDREMMLYVYRERDTFEDNVYQASLLYMTPQDRIWQLNDECIKRVAKLKNLI